MANESSEAARPALSSSIDDTIAHCHENLMPASGAGGGTKKKGKKNKRSNPNSTKMALRAWLVLATITDIIIPRDITSFVLCWR